MCDNTRICKHCEEEKCVLEFKKVYRNKSGYSSECKVCKEIFSGIYKITSPTGKVYIGQSEDINRRFGEYKRLKNCKRQTKLYRSFKKHGVENHQFDIIEYCSEHELNCSERFWQDEFDVLNGGLNCVLTECGDKKAIFSEESRKIKGQKGDKNYFYGKKGNLSMWFGVKGEAHPNFGKVAWNKGLILENMRGENSPNWGKGRSQG